MMTNTHPRPCSGRFLFTLSFEGRRAFLFRHSAGLHEI